ncbi:MAG: bacillithiol biosynthesis cysteine-adding enzyme BshC [bacterium]
MANTKIDYKTTTYYSSLICDYLDKEKNVQSLYHRFPELSNFEAQIMEKKASFTLENRKILVDALVQQYEDFEVSEATQQHIQYLISENTFTVTTGHQLNLFTGPLYFLYKIIAAINLAKQLKEAYPNYNFVPVYWMASEDHDFDEINYFNFKGKKIQWNQDSSGAVGRLNTERLSEVAEVVRQQFGGSENAKELFRLFEEGYNKNKTLVDATRYIANELFKEYGLVIVDGDDRSLKALFTPYVKKELHEELAFNEVKKVNSYLADQKYKVQVNPREINLFYLDDNLRSRIVKNENGFAVHNTDLSFSESELLQLVDNAPEKFSPNALLRPLYQEVILPNLCYIGGGGEIAYWLQLKSYFERVAVPFPMLLLRNSLLLMNENQEKKLDKLDVAIQNLFLNKADLQKYLVHKISKVQIDFSEEKAHLVKQFEHLYAIAKKTDRSFEGAVAAQERKQMKGLERLEKRMLKAQKRKLADELGRVTDLQEQLFPKGSLQERNTNFSEFYLNYGSTLLDQLKDVIDPLDLTFKVTTLKS